MPQTFHVKAERIPDPGKHVFIALLSGRPMEAAMLEFFWQTQADLLNRGFAADLFILAGHCHVDDARNQCIWEYRRTACSHFLFIDDDTCTSKGVVGDLLACDRPVLAGSYPFKGDEVDFPIRLLKGRPFEPEADGCVAVEMVPTGFMMMKREVIEAACAAARHYYNKEATRDGPHGGIPLLFEREIDDLDDRWGGDYNFCRKLIRLGIPIYVKPDYWFRHYGVKAFTANLAVHRAEKEGRQTPAFDQAVEAIRAGAGMTPDFFQLSVDWPNQYAMPPDALQAAYLMGLEAKGPMLETGSGLSTLLLGLAAERSGQKVFALEHDPDYYARTAALLKRYSLKTVRLIYAPLQKHQYTPDRSCLWYSNLGELPDSFSLVVLDGPQRRFGRMGLFKVLPHDMMAEAAILADDMDDQIERAQLREQVEAMGRKFSLIEGEVRDFAVILPAEAQAKVSQVA